MPLVNKQALSQYIRTGCERQLALNLYPDSTAFAAERQSLAMPYQQSPRPGLRQIQAAGEDWQAEKLQDLTQTFGTTAVIGDSYVTPANETRYQATPLTQVLGPVQPVRFLVEAEFEVGARFQQALGIDNLGAQFNLRYARVRPDIICVLPPGTFSRSVLPDGSTAPLPAGDTRRQLRVIDIKMTAQPSPSYFAEVAYYSIALAAWLLDNRLESQFVVVPDGAVWPGSHDASRLRLISRQIAAHQTPDPVPPEHTALHQQLLASGLAPDAARLVVALEEDLEPAPFEVFALRIRRFFSVELPRVLGQAWQSLEWHVDNRCSFCEYLGENRGANAVPPQAPHQDHCLPTALRMDHVSRVAFISQGARLSLAMHPTSPTQTVTALAQLQAADPIFDEHQALRATRTVVARRAAVLQGGQAAIAPQSGTSAVMPRWADLHIYLSVDFDIGSAITVAFGLKAFWLEPRPFGANLPNQRQTRVWQSTARVVAQRDILVEQRELLAFLQEIHNILSFAQQQDQQQIRAQGVQPRQQANWRTKVQFYLWDSLQFDHLSRIIGRHLQAVLQNQNLNYLAWLFPPEELLPNPDMATCRSPITIVRDVVRGHLAAPVPHYYSLVEVARLYHDQRTAAYIAQQHASNPSYVPFNVHPLFGTPLSDQIPSERAHEIWSQVTTPRHWQDQLNTYRNTVTLHLDALETVTRRLEDDFGNTLTQAAPVIEISPPQTQTRVSSDGQLWHAFARLNEAISEAETHQIRAMPPHERAARFKSARLTTRLTGQAEVMALAQLGVPARVGRRVYELRQDSREVKARAGDFSFAISPENAGGFLDRKLSGLVRNTPLDQQYQAQFGPRYWQVLLEEMCGVTISALDRNRGLIAIDLGQSTVVDALEAAGLFNLSQDCILDPVHSDFFTPKLLASLQAIGNPPVARTSPFIARSQAATATPAAPGSRRRGANQTPHTPAAEFLWNAGAMATTAINRNLGPVQPVLAANGLDLNATQWQAWRDALTHRAWLVWGPPGTGKSRTVRAVVVGAVIAAHQAATPLRVLVSAATYKAIDNVLIEVAGDLNRILPGSCPVYRLRSRYEAPPTGIAPAIDVELNRRNASALVRQMRSDLSNPSGLLVVGATPQQVHNFLTADNGQAQAEWFDLLLIDEASQMDVGQAVLPFCAVASGGAVVLAGDPMQLPPIHQAEPPVGLEDVVGPVYSFFERAHRVPFSALGVNYRSNDSIVEFARQSGYQATLRAQSPQLRIDLLNALPTTQPPNWPASLHWTPEWSTILDPARPAVCFVYDDGRSSQRNVFEAEAVASLLWLLSGRMSNQLLGENDAATGSPIASSTTPYTPQEFWEQAVGVVTPHRAQQGLIVSRLQQAFGATGQIADAIRDAVDTVERFQGQERDVMIASFALGDPDQIGEEEEFLMSLNRFNVMASRARAKLIVLVSRQVVDHLASELEVLRESRLLKVFVENFCNQSTAATLGYLQNGAVRPVPGDLRWRT